MSQTMAIQTKGTCQPLSEGITLAIVLTALWQRAEYDLKGLRGTVPTHRQRWELPFFWTFPIQKSIIRLKFIAVENTVSNLESG